MQNIVDDKGVPVKLGAILGRGGEGIIYEVSTNSAVVAKIYHQQLAGAKSEKLAAMVSSISPDLLKFAAWPTGILESNGNRVGLLMRRIAPGDKPVHELYSPKSRLRDFPAADWLYLIHAAANIARGFAVIHKAGHVIGDVNHGNILMAANATSAFIDCDSFQVRSGGRVFLCEVGVPEFTPPELQNRTFSSIERTQNHDAFGLAVLIFHLLFMGRHPFAGRFSGIGEMPIARAISECRFPFGRLAKLQQMSPPPNSLTLGQLPSPIADAFERAFSAEAAKGAQRPSATEWLSILETAKSELTRCKSNHSHFYFSRLAACPWCDIESCGIILFVERISSSLVSLNLTDLWKKLDGLPVLGTLPAIPTLSTSSFHAVATPELKARGKSRRTRIAIGVIGVIATVGVVTGLGINAEFSVPLVVVSILIALKLQLGLQKARTYEARLLQESQAQGRQLQIKYAAECAEQAFLNQLAALEKMRADYNGLPLQRQRQLQELEKNKIQVQLHQYLDRASMRTAQISNIGPSRKLMLSSYGIDTAADVTFASLNLVPGIGTRLAQNILAWRSSVERKFRFDSSQPTDQMEIQKIDRAIRSRRAELEKALIRGVQEAVATHFSITTRRKSYLEQLNSNIEVQLQAMANYRAS